jgi:hypothetical protein
MPSKSRLLLWLYLIVSVCLAASAAEAQQASCTPVQCYQNALEALQAAQAAYEQAQATLASLQAKIDSLTSQNTELNSEISTLVETDKTFSTDETSFGKLTGIIYANDGRCEDLGPGFHQLTYLLLAAHASGGAVNTSAGSLVGVPAIAPLPAGFSFVQAQLCGR